MGGVLAYPKLGVILAYWKQTGVSSPENPTGENQLARLRVGVSMLNLLESARL